MGTFRVCHGVRRAGRSGARRGRWQEGRRKGQVRTGGVAAGRILAAPCDVRAQAASGARGGGSSIWPFRIAVVSRRASRSGRSRPGRPLSPDGPGVTGCAPCPDGSPSADPRSEDAPDRATDEAIWRCQYRWALTDRSGEAPTDDTLEAFRLSPGAEALIEAALVTFDLAGQVRRYVRGEGGAFGRWQPVDLVWVVVDKEGRLVRRPSPPL